MVVRQSLCMWASCAAAKKPLSVQFVLDVKFGFSIFSDDAMKKPGHSQVYTRTPTTASTTRSRLSISVNRASTLS